MKTQIITKRKKRIAIIFLCLIFIFQAFPIVGCTSDNTDAGAGSGTTESLEITNADPIETTDIIEETSPFFWMYTPELEPLTQEQVDACNQAYRLLCLGTLEEYIATWPEGKEQAAEKDYYELTFISRYRGRPYLGTFNGAVVSTWFMDATVETRIEIAGYVMTFPTSGSIQVYKDGEICDITIAYEKGWLTDDNIKTISERVEKYHNTKYGRN